MSMFLWETAIIILFALILMGLILMNFQDFFEDTAAVKLSALFGLDRIWVSFINGSCTFRCGWGIAGTTVCKDTRYSGIPPDTRKVKRAGNDRCCLSSLPV